MAQDKAPGKARKVMRERFKHVAWAGLIAFVLQWLTLIHPIDQLSWNVQSRLASFDASGEIVFVGSQQDLTDPEFPQRRAQLADLIERIDRAGAKDIYLDILFDQNAGKADVALNEVLRAGNGQIFLVENMKTGLNGVDTLQSSVPVISDGVPKVGGQIWSDVLGQVWWMPYSVENGTSRLPTLSAQLAGMAGTKDDPHLISYFFELESIPTYSFQELSDSSGNLEPLAGKSVVIGLAKPMRATKLNMPGITDVAPSLVHIYAAETLKAGQTSHLGGYAILCAILALLAMASLIPSRNARSYCYMAIVLSLPLTLLFLTQLPMHFSPASAVTALVFFAIYRGRARWKDSFHLVDPETQLPTFTALEADRKIAEHVPSIIVARIHRFEEVRRTLPRELHTEYVLRIIARLQAATQDATIYIGKGSMLAWTMHDTDTEVLTEHLEGLRALFSSPLLVGENQVDVGITFGVDVSPSPNVTRRLAAAVSAAEQTTETFDPIVVSDRASEEDLIWNISLQARIDKALANGEIFLVFQPKVHLQSGKMVGVESLVRWRDPVKGIIPPDQFIRQCENAGRMAHLTKHVLIQACEASLRFEANGVRVPVAVNISATMLHERAIVTMVREVLEETGLEPTRLTLEVTETYRITNLDRAAVILGELDALGTKISMDDFGVGAASLEALVRLPFSELKIDRLFVSRMAEDAKALAIVRSVLQLGRESRITVVAEGVETIETLNLLRESGCPIAQGYRISRPVSFDEIIDFQNVIENQMLKNIV